MTSPRGLEALLSRSATSTECTAAISGYWPALRAKADSAGVPALAITFDPHPVTLLRPDKAPVPLVWPEREINLLKEAGATEVGVFRTGQWLLELSAREFFDQVIRAQLDAHGIVEGPNFAFGHDRLGDSSILRDWCAEAGIDFEVVEATVIEDRLVSSSLIRQCLNEGLVHEATRLLGPPASNPWPGRPRCRPRRGAGIPDRQSRGDRHSHSARRSLCGLGMDRRKRTGMAGRLQCRTQPDFRRTYPQSRGTSDRF